MRERTKKSILNLLSTMMEAAAYLSRKSGAVGDPLKDDLEAGAGSVFPLLGLERVPELDQLCTACRECMEAADFGTVSHCLKKLHKYISDRVEGTFEILFLPYKADMWDSFDSVWRTAVQNKRMHVTVMPIPYYSKEQDGPARMFYDGLDFPPDVPVTDYRMYSLEEVEPDVIFIHFPYDDQNIVTGIDEKYYSKNLAGHTDLLVYIPYYVSNGLGLPEHMIRLPGVANASVTFVESDPVKEQYLEWPVLRGGQVKALGSPKLDAVVNPPRTPLPESWKMRMQGQKVFLLNTALSDLLADEQAFFQQIEEVIDLFSAGKGAVLLWRPHPLLRQTIATMRPEYLIKYDALFEKARQSKWVVIDETKDFHPAFVVSDAYLGSQGSLMSLYLATGKPLMILFEKNILPALPQHDIHQYSFFCAAGDNGRFYYCANEYGVLFSLDLPEGKIRFICDLPRDRKGVYQFQFKSIACYKGMVWLIPGNGEAIFRVDPDTGDIMRLEAPRHICQEGAPIFSDAVRDGRYLWCLPVKFGHLVRLDLETGDLAEYFLGGTDPKDTCNTRRYVGFTIHSGTIWLAPFENKEALSFHISDGSVRAYPLECEKPRSFCTALAANRYIWFIPFQETFVLRLDPDTGEQARFDGWPKGFQWTTALFIDACYDGDFLWLSPYSANQIVRLDPLTGGMEGFAGWPEELKFEYEYIPELDNSKFLKPFVYENEIWFPPYRCNMLVALDRSTGNMRGIPTDTRTMAMSCHRLEMLRKFHRYIYRKDICDVKQFVDLVRMGKDNLGKERIRDVRKRMKNADGTAGQKIWKCIERGLL